MGARITVENHIATVVLDRPQAMNSIDPEMREATIQGAVNIV